MPHWPNWRARRRCKQLPVLAIPNLAHDLEYANQLPAAERLLRAWQWRYPGNFWLNHSLGWVLMQPAVRAGEAVRYMTAALALRSDSPGVYIDLSYALDNSNDAEGAIRACQAAVAVDPNYAAAHSRRILPSLQLKGATWRGHPRIPGRDPDQPQRPLASCRPGQSPAHARATWTGPSANARPRSRSTPTTPRPTTSWATCSWRKNDLEGAIREYQAAIKIDANYAVGHRNLGEALLAKNDVEGAIRETPHRPQDRP